ncbi:hypothetical protein B0H17DRAFT_1147926 [Mycena rosella]|uniref:Uncharacterized protein n=1 Tax=Mycena rosella TaxID=1033263 RepID=A0AAD7FXS8_MYCRO|nr:hypothetical protein B0H17DRAFT_1147926 [Mycena rosella]
MKTEAPSAHIERIGSSRQYHKWGWDLPPNGTCRWELPSIPQVRMAAPAYTVNGDGSSRPNHKWERELHLRVGAPGQSMGSVQELLAMSCGSTHAVVHGYIQCAMGPPTEVSWELPPAPVEAPI